MKALLDVFANKVTIGDDCWEWTGSRGLKGYGLVNRQRRLRKAHQLMYEMMIGPIPDGLEPDHLCRNKGCVRPDHIEYVTHQENMRRSHAPMGVNARKTHCLRGHEFTDENTLNRGAGRRECRTCKKERRHGST